MRGTVAFRSWEIGLVLMCATWGWASEPPPPPGEHGETLPRTVAESELASGVVDREDDAKSEERQRDWLRDQYSEGVNSRRLLEVIDRRVSTMTSDELKLAIRKQLRKRTGGATNTATARTQVVGDQVNGYLGLTAAFGPSPFGPAAFGGPSIAATFVPYSYYPTVPVYGGVDPYRYGCRRPRYGRTRIVRVEPPRPPQPEVWYDGLRTRYEVRPRDRR